MNRCLWIFWVYLIRILGVPFHLSPANVPKDEGKKLYEAALQNEVILVFNAGGFGNAPLSEAADFAPILEGIQQTLTRLGYRSIVSPYNRTYSGLAGRIAGTKEQLNNFKHTCKTQIKDLEYLADRFPEKRFLIVGFSVGGGLSFKTLQKIANRPNVLGITVGAPGWYKTYSSETCLVLNNSNQDPLCIGDVNTIAKSVFNWPIQWLKSRTTNRNLSIALALKIPHHEYSWESSEVGEPIVHFIKKHFKAQIQ
jgi:hypothetical protein